ncbi:MAG: glutaredoxin domain-containing protein [Bacteroidota bacterium]
MRILLLVLIAASGWVGLTQVRAHQHGAAEQQAAATAEVVVYVTSWCEVCATAQAHLDTRGIEYVTRDIETEPDAFDDYRARGGTGVIPMLVVRGETLMGFDPEAVDARLLAARDRS